MRIAVEMPFDNEGKRGWIYYTESLLRELAKIDRSDEYLVFNFFFRSYREKIKRIYCPASPNFRMLVRRWPESLVTRMEWAWKIPLIEASLRAQKVSVFHAARPPCSARVPFLVTSHDIMYLRHPEHMYPKMRWGYEKSGLPGFKLAARVITHSEYHKRELVEFLGVDERKIRAIPTGANTDIFHPVSDTARLDEARARLRLPRRFILMIGPFSRWWCDYDAAIRAFQRLCAGHPELGLVLLGDDSSPGAVRLRELGERLGVDGRIARLGRVSGEDLLAVCNLAVCNVYPAWDSGCSINVLDSMSAGLPVVTAPVSLLPEMLGDAGVWADIKSPAEMEAALRRLVEDEAFRAAKSEQCLRRARARTWEATARQTLALYREIAGV